MRGAFNIWETENNLPEGTKKKASPPGPLDAYELNIKTLQARFPARFSIMAMVDEINRMEKWQDNRDEIEELVAAGTPPKYWDPLQPWAVAIWRESQDRD